MAKFLSQDWFNQVDQLTQQAGDLNLSPAIKNISLNLNVTQPSGNTVDASFYNGMIHQGNKEGALTSVTLDEETLQAIFLKRDLNKAMEAFMTGKIRVDGDMGQLMSIQTASVSPEQKAFLKQVVDITEV